MHAKKQEKSINQPKPMRNDTGVRISKNVKIVILTEFRMFRKLEKRFNTLSREKEVMKKTNIGH